MAQIPFTDSKVINEWKPEKSAPLFRKNVVLEVVGKTSVVTTKNSAYQHVFLSNGDSHYRLIVWKEKLQECSEKLKIQSVVRLSGLKVEVFFFNDKDVVPAELHANSQFVCITDTKITVLLNKPLVAYPEKNMFPPFWKPIKQLILGDVEIAMSVLLLNKPIQKSILLDGDNRYGVFSQIGDASAFKISFFVVFNPKDEEENEIAEELQTNMELMIAGGKVIRMSDDKMMLMVSKIYCLKQVVEADQKLTRLGNYEEVTLANPPSVKKARRSDFF